MENEFKPFDRILVKNVVWKCAFFSNYVQTKDGISTPIVETTNGEVYHKDFCLPYEGNEGLLGTDKTPKSNRWRAAKGEVYWFVGTGAKAVDDDDYYQSNSDNRYLAGNYFKCKEDAEAVAKEFQKILERYGQGKIGLEQHDLGTCPTENDVKPSKEDILKVIRMLKDPCGAVMDLTYSEEETANIIWNNWNHF